MEKAYIILAHKNPRQLLQLITRLDDNKSEFFLHIDKKSDLTQFRAVVDYGSNVHLVQRELTNWGGFGLVKATLNALEMIREYKIFDRVILLSGQDYPIKNNGFINRFFKTTPASIFLEYTAIPDYNRWHTTGGMYRINKYFFGLKTYQRYAAKALNLGSKFLPALQRKIPNGLKPYAGSQWWTIDNYALNYILNYIKDNPVYTAFHKYTFAPDEVYFHTILLNSTDERIVTKISNNNLMYARWLHATSSHPEIVSKHSVEELVYSSDLFARKFEQEADTEVFDQINTHCNQIEKQMMEQNK